MIRIKAIIYLSLVLFTQNLFAQVDEVSEVDTISFQIRRDVANVYKVNCVAYKVDIEAADTIFEAFTLSDTVNNAYTISWSGDENPLNPSNTNRASYQYSAPGAYEIVLTVTEDSSGNSFTATDTAYIRDIISVPNVFTPNDDGINDLFIVRASGVEPIEIFIYSQTGTLVFKEKSPIIVWDGRNSSGSKVSQGIYYYILKPSSATHEEQTGYIYLFPDENSF